MQLPTHITRMAGPSSSANASSSVSYDYSGEDTIQKRQDEASQMHAARRKALYDGDVSGALAAGDRIRTLLDSLASIRPVRVASESSSSSFDKGSSAFEGEHDDLEYVKSQGRKGK